MRSLISISLIFIGISANADLTVYGEYKDESESCVPSANFNHRITQKISNNLYELHGDGMSSMPRALLKTKKAIFDRTGVPAALGIKRSGSKDMTLENGFSASYAVWEECGLDISAICGNPGGDPTFAWPKKLKDLDCSSPEKYVEKISKKPAKSKKKK